MRGSAGSTGAGGDGTGEGSPHLPGSSSPLPGGGVPFYPGGGADPRHEHPGGAYSPELPGGGGGDGPDSRKRPYSRTSSTDSLEVSVLLLYCAIVSIKSRFFEIINLEYLLAMSYFIY